MAVDAVYLLDEKKRIRRVIVWGVYELIHDEATYELDAEIDGGYDAKPGEFLAFFDIDGNIRLFEIDEAELDEQRGIQVITATDAAVKELAHLIVQEVRLEDGTAEAAARAALEGSGWTLGKTDGGSKKAGISAYMDKRWKVLRDIAATYGVRVTPRFEMKNGEVAGRIVDITARENTYRGRILEGRHGNAQIYVTKSGAPITRMYGVGKAIGTEDPPSCVTFKDIEAPDKPRGQAYIEDAEAIAQYGEGREDVYTDKNITDAHELLEKTREELKKRTKPKVRGSATASDMEHIPGHEHKIVRMYDMIWVRTRTGEDVSAVVINVKRNYLRRGMTKFTLGEEADTSAATIGLIGKVAQVQSESRSHGRSSAAASNRYIETKQLIQFNAETIQANARLIEANAEWILLNADKIDDVTGRVTHAELELYGDGTTAKAGLLARVNENEAALILHADEIGTLAAVKADVTYVDRLVAERISAAFADFTTALTKNINTDQISVKGTAEVGTLKIEKEAVSKEKVKVIESISGLTTTEKTMLTTGGDEPETVTFYQRGALFEGTAFKTAETRQYYSRGEAVENAFYRGALVKLQGTAYTGKLYDADGEPVTGLYLGDGSYVNRIGSECGVLYKSGSEVTVTVGVDEHTEPLYQPGTKVSITTRDVTALTVPETDAS